MGPSTVCGDLRSAGLVDLSGTPINVLGELKEKAAAAPLPDIPLVRFDPVARGLNPVQFAGAPTNSPILDSPTLSTGPFIVNGDLTLKNSLLYVKGDLEVKGKLMGQGALIVEGKTHLHGSADMDASGRVALISQGDIILEGAGPASSCFQGLVYTRGKLTARGLTIMGCLIAAPPPAPLSGPQIYLQNCVVIQDSTGVSLGSRKKVLQINGNELTPARYWSPMSFLQAAPQKIHCRASDATEVTVDVSVPSDVTAFSAFFRLNDGNRPGPHHPRVRDPLRSDAQVADAATDDYADTLRSLNRYLRSVPLPGEDAVDLNEFLRYEDKLRVASYRDVPLTVNMAASK